MPPKRAAHTIDALYAIGRNVVNFQRLEQILKQLALFDAHLRDAVKAPKRG